MPINFGLAHLSDHFLLATVALYAFAMLAYAGDFAFGRARSRAAKAAAVPAAAARAVVPAGVAASVAGAPAVAAPTDADSVPAGGGPADGGTAAVSAGRTASGGVSGWVKAALGLMVAGLACHILGILTRGLSEDRVPWGNMYEFITAITCAAVMALLVVMIRYRVYSIGLFVMAPIVLSLGLASTVLYTAAGPLVPALHSYWIAIHVTAMIIAIGSYLVAAVFTMMFLISDYHNRRGRDSEGTDQPAKGFGVILERLPSREALDRLSYRTVVFAFPVWTFAIIAGAIWADQAWGRYWGWDPKETWSFITWVVYAGYLHARATAGWRGRRAAYIHIVAFACLMFNLVGVNLWITGLHSYAGVS